MARDAAGMIEELLNDRDLIADDALPHDLEIVQCNRSRRIQTLFGPIEITRNYHYHTKAKNGYCPLDEQLDLVGGYTPSLARLICRASAQSSSYQQGSEDLQAYTGLSLESRGFGRLVERLAPELDEGLAALPPGLNQTSLSIPVMYVSSDGTGIPVRREQLTGRKGKQPDGTSHTREAKLGCVFTQSCRDENGEPIRDPQSTSYVGTLHGCREIGTLLRNEAYRRGYAQTEKIVYLGDGAAWLWENARINFPGAVEILDFYHAAEHAGDLAKAIWGEGSPKAEEYQSRWCKKMKQTSAAPVIKSARRLLADPSGRLDPQQREDAEREINYFQTNERRTRYGHFREQGYFIGSGVIEAGCKTVIGQRMKQSGMFWGESGAQHLLGIRCLLFGPHFDDAWQARRVVLSEKRRKARRWNPSLN